MPDPEARTTSIEVSGHDGILFDGEGEFGPGPERELGRRWDWSLEFLVPTLRVAQFQARLGEEVELRFGDGTLERAWIGRFGFEPDADSSGFRGHGRIQLLGRGPVPNP